MLSRELAYLLYESIKKCKDARERERLRALYAVSVGYPLHVVADIFTVDEGTVYRWIERWHEERSLVDKPKVGRPGALSDEDKRCLIDAVNGGEPRAHGIETEYWSTKDLCSLLRKRGRRVSQETVRRFLRDMGARYIKPGSDEDFSERRGGHPGACERLSPPNRLIENLKLNQHSLAALLDDEFLLGDPQKKNCGWVFGK